MSYYVPGLGEKDQDKVIRSLMQSHENTATNTADIATNTADIATNTADIATNTADIATNTADIATNTADIATLFAAGVFGIAIGSYASNSDLTTVIPLDDTIPQSSEGTQIISVAYTPKYSTSTLICEFTGQVTAAAADNVVAALFNGAANAFAAEMVNITAANLKVSFALTGSYAPGSTSAQTITVRVGAGSQIVRMNGTSAGRLLGGVSAAVLTVYEIK